MGCCMLILSAAVVQFYTGIVVLLGCTQTHAYTYARTCSRAKLPLTKGDDGNIAFRLPSFIATWGVIVKVLCYKTTAPSRPPMHRVLARGAYGVRGSLIRDIFDGAKKLEGEGRSIINLGVGQPSFPAPEVRVWIRVWVRVWVRVMRSARMETTKNVSGLGGEGTF